MADTIVIDRKDVDLFHSSDTLAATLGPAYDSGFVLGKYLLVVISPTRSIEVRVTGGRRMPFGRHNWLLDIECDQMEELRDALTYEVAGRAEIVPEYEGDECVTS